MMTPTRTSIDLDIRLFKRYSLQVPLALTVESRSYSAKTTDFSPHGIGILVDGCPPLQVGGELMISLRVFGMRERVRVAWKKEIAAGLRVGVLRTGPLRGALGQYRISDLFIGLHRTAKTGILEVRDGPAVKKVYFRKGNPIFATSSQERDRLGDILLKRRVITKEQYRQAAERKKETGERYAVILVDLGFVKPAELFTTVKIQVQRIMGSILLMRDGEFEFMETALPMEEVVPLNISIANLIYRQVKKHADADLVREHLLDSVIDFSKTPLHLFQDVRLARKDRELLSHVGGRKSVRDIIARSGADSQDALKSIFALLEAKILEIRKKNETSSGLTSDEVFSKDKASPSELIEMIERMHASYQKLGYYGVLGLSGTGYATDAIRKAYYESAKRFHPDRHFGLPEETTSKLTEIFTYITNAYITLSNQEKKREYDRRMTGNSATGGVSSVGPDIAGPTAEQRHRAAKNVETAKNKFAKGLEMLWMGRVEDAADLFAAAIYFDNSVPEYHFQSGRCLVKMQKPKEAVAALNRALEADRNKPDILAELGHAYIQLGFPLRAERFFKQALGLHAAHKRAAEGLAVLKKKKK